MNCISMYVIKMLWEDNVKSRDFSCLLISNHHYSILTKHAVFILTCENKMERWIIWSCLGKDKYSTPSIRHCCHTDNLLRTGGRGGGWLVHQCAVKQPPNSFQTDLRETYVFLRTASKLQLDLLPGQPSAGLGTGYKTIRPEVRS